MKYEIEHYYGDIVRYLFLAAGVVMLITLPLFQANINLPIIISIIAITILGIAAGLTNPKQLTSRLTNFIISVIGFIVFGYSAVNSFGVVNGDKFLLTNILLAIIFLFALYFSMKTLRAGLLVK